MSTNDRFAAGVAAVCALSIVLAAMLMSAFVPPAIPVDGSGDGFGPPNDEKEPKRSGGGSGGAGEGSGGVGVEPGEGGDADEYDVSLNRSAVPGAHVVVTVTNDGLPVHGLLVRFNGERVGVTDESGQVAGTIPYESELQISVRKRDAKSLDPVAVVASQQYALASGAAIGPAGSSPSSGADARSLPHNDTTGSYYRLNTTGNVDVDGILREGKTVTIAANVEDVPMREAEVTVDGEPLAVTDDRGRAEVTLPYDERVRIVVSRGDVNGTVVVEPKPTINTSVSGLVVPGTSVTLHATRHGEPVSGAAVRVDGETVGTTGPDGTVEFTLPRRNSVDVVVTHGEAKGTSDLDWLFAWFVVPLTGLLVVLGGVHLHRQTASRRPRVVTPLVGLFVGSVRWLAGATAMVAEAVLSGLVAVGTILARVIERTTRLLAWLLAGLWRYLSLLVRTPWEAFWLFVLAAITLPGRLVRALVQLLRWLLFWRRTTTATAAATGGGSPIVNPGSGGTPSEPSGDDAGGQSVVSVRRAWRELVALLPVSDTETKTPGELERAAVDMGLPEAPVGELTDAYREVRYGGRDDRSYRERAMAALRSVREWFSEVRG